VPVYISRVDLSGEHSVTIKSALHRGRGYIATAMVILPQASVRLAFELPEIVEAEAVVTWENQTNPEDGLPPGYGMRLTRVPPETARAIRETHEPRGRTSGTHLGDRRRVVVHAGTRLALDPIEAPLTARATVELSTAHRSCRFSPGRISRRYASIPSSTSQCRG
jgi:hypothetical protein